MFQNMQQDHPLRWLYLDLNSFFASVEQQLNPKLRGRPVAVGPERINSGTIIAASYEAKAFGIKTGMKVAEARQRCPDLVFAGGDHSSYTHFHQLIVQEIGKHIPITHICSIDEVACRLMKNEAAPAVASQLAQRIKDSIRKNVGACLTSSVGIAPSRLLAKIASDMQKPDGLTIIQASDLPHILLPLSLRDIPGVGPRMEQRLHARGIKTMAQLLSQDPTEAGNNWGSVVGTRMWFALNGHDLPEPDRKSKSIGHSHVLAPELRNPQSSRLVARRLLTKAASRLRDGGYVTRNLTLHVRFQSQKKWAASAKTPITDESFQLLDALECLWAQFEEVLAKHPKRDQMQMIGVSLDDIRKPETQDKPGHQLSLFDTPKSPTSTYRQEIGRTLDIIQSKFGKNSISLGINAKDRTNLIGTKIAFGRIPEKNDF